MRGNGRKELTMIYFEGVAADGGFVFTAYVFYPNVPKLAHNGTGTSFKATAYADGSREIAIDYREDIAKVAELVSGMFSEKSNFANLDSLILNYKNIRLRVGKNNGRKDIICMLMKAMAMPGYKNVDNDVSVDTEVYQKCIHLRNSNPFINAKGDLSEYIDYAIRICTILILIRYGILKKVI